jgi:Zn-finger nucleic acid-binding protein
MRCAEDDFLRARAQVTKPANKRVHRFCRKPSNMLRRLQHERRLVKAVAVPVEGVEFESSAKKCEHADMQCAKCGTETLSEFFIQGVAVERCSSCTGIWFDARELGQLLAEDARHIASLRRGTLKEQLDGKRGYCPRDGSELLRMYSSIDHSVILDACPDCRGIWLDEGEFEKLFDAR